MGVFEQNIIKSQNQDEFWQKSRNAFSQEKSTTLLNRFSNPNYLANTNSKAIQPVIKIISKQTGAVAVRSLLDYISREVKAEEEKLAIEDQNLNNYQNRDLRENLLENWQKDFVGKEKYQSQQWKLDILKDLEEKRNELDKLPQEQLTEEQKQQLEKLNHQIDNQYCFKEIVDKSTGTIKERKLDLKVKGAADTTHIMLSVGGKPDEKKATIATRNFLTNNLAAAGFEYAFVKHNDTNNLHYHLVIKNKSLFNKNLRFDKADLFILRQEYARELSMMGIERTTSLRRDRVEILEKVKKDIENLKERDSWYKNQLKKTDDKTLKEKKKDQNFDVFAYRANLLKQTQFLIEKVKDIKGNYYSGVAQNLKEDLQYLKNFKEQIKTTNPEEVKIAKEKTINYLAKSHNELLKQIKNLDNPEQFAKEEKLNYQNQQTKEGSIKDKTEQNYQIQNQEIGQVELKANNQDQQQEQKQIINKSQNYYIPDLSQSEIKDKFKEAIFENLGNKFTGLENALDKAFNNPSTKIRFGKKSEHEVCWHGEAGYIKSYKTGEFISWGVNNIKRDIGMKFKEISPQELEQKRINEEQITKELEAQKQQEAQKVAIKAKQYFDSYKSNNIKESQYLKNKLIDDLEIQGVKYHKGSLVIPVKDTEGKISTLQYINDDGSKKFLTGGKKQGNFFVFGEEKLNKIKNQQIQQNETNKTNIKNNIYIAEGFATAASVFKATNELVVVCFDAGNIEHTLKNLKEKYPDQNFIIAADNDLWKEKNTGKEKAEEAAKKFGATVILPQFRYEHKDEVNLPTDFNDLEKLLGKEEVKRQINEMILDKNNQFIAEKTTDSNLKQKPEEQEIKQNQDLENIKKENQTILKTKETITSKLKEINPDQDKTPKKRLPLSQKRRKEQYLNTLLKKHIDNLSETKKLLAQNIADKDLQNPNPQQRIENIKIYQQNLKQLDEMIKQSKKVVRGSGINLKLI